MLLFSEQEFAAGGHGNLDADSIVMVTSRQATRSRILRKVWAADFAMSGWEEMA